MGRGGAPPISPTYSTHQPVAQQPASASALSIRSRVASNARPTRPTVEAPIDRFRKVVRKVITLHRSATMLSTRGAGAEPGVDPRRASADLHFGGIKQDCVIELFDYSVVRSSFGRMTNKEFIQFIGDKAASKKEPWVKVRWINIGGMSWDVIKAVSLKYGESLTSTGLDKLELDICNRASPSGTRRRVSYPKPYTLQSRLLRSASLPSRPLSRARRSR